MRRAIRCAVVLLMLAIMPIMASAPAALARQSTDCTGLDAYLVVLETMGDQLGEALPASGETNMDEWTPDEYTAASDAVDTAVTDLQDAQVPAVAEEFNTLLISQLQLLSSMFDTMATTGVFGALIYAEQLDKIDKELETAAGTIETACGVDLYETVEESAPDATPPSDTGAINSDDDDDTTLPGAAGTRANPIPIGQTVAIGDDWELTVLSVTPDATDLVMAENSFNDPPAPGHQYLLVTVRLTYTGDDSDEFYGWGLRAVGQSAVSYSQFEDSCGVTPDELSSRELFTGGTIEGNLCWSVATEDADSLVLYDGDLDSDERVYLSLIPTGAIATPEAATR